MTGTPALPIYTGDALAACTPQQLIEYLIQDEDRAPRNLIDECARRGDAMIGLLRNVHDFDPATRDDTGRWWLKLHAVKILGLMSAETAGLLMVEHMSLMSVDEDEVLQDWLAGRWPALFMNKPASVMTALRTLVEDPQHDWYIRVEAMIAHVALARREGSAALEAALQWVTSMAANQREGWDMRLLAANLLLDFPRKHNLELLRKLAKRQKHLGRIFGIDEVAQAFIAMVDRPSWEERNFDPWLFYAPEEIAERQKRWAEEKAREREAEQRWIRQGEHMEDAPIPLLRDTPKIGRNDPCPCGSGKKYKKCCLNQ